MSKVISFIILSISLFFIETIACFFIVLFYFIFDSLDFIGSLNSTILWNFWRVLFYGFPWIIFYFLLFKYVGNIKLFKPLIFSLFNMSIYVALSILSRVIWGKNVPLPPEGIMFWITCVSILISPFILRELPYFKNLMKRL